MDGRQMKFVPLVGILCLAALSGCPSVAVKPEASTDQTAKNVADLAAKVDTMNGALTQVTKTVNSFESTLNQVTTTTTAQAGSTQALAEKVQGDLKNFKTGLDTAIGTVGRDVNSLVKSKDISNTNNPWMFSLMALGAVLLAFAFVWWMVRFIFKLMTNAQNAKNLLQAAIMDKGNDLDDVKAASLVDKVKDLKAKGIL
jgi:outer membrane murein-binding lipoprotein Lpp